MIRVYKFETVFVMLKKMMMMMTSTVTGLNESGFHLSMSFLALPTLQFSLNFFLTHQITFRTLLFVLRILKIDMEAQLSASESGMSIVKTYARM